MNIKSPPKRNAGFSLVELIVVISIMVVLVAVLSVTILGYVDRAKIAKDVQAADELSRAVKRSLTLGEEDLHKEIVAGNLLANINWNVTNAKISDSVESSNILFYLNKEMGGYMPVSSFNESCLWALDVQYENDVPAVENLIIKIYLGPTDKVGDMTSGSGYDAKYMLYPETGSFWRR